MYTSAGWQEGRIHAKIGRKEGWQMFKTAGKQEGRYTCTVHIGQAGRKAGIQVPIGRQVERQIYKFTSGRQAGRQVYKCTSAGRQEGRQVYIYASAGRQKCSYT
jgi:hypothetical protein